MTATLQPTPTVDTFTPLQDWLLVEPHEATETAGGIALVESDDSEDLRHGIVLKAGPGAFSETPPYERRPLDIDPGEHVWWQPQGSYMPPRQIRLEGKTYWLVRAKAVVAVDSQ